MVTRHEFLSDLHLLLQPRLYLEIGVQYGHSLKLANCQAIGIDPDPQVMLHRENETIFEMTSDDFFALPTFSPPDTLDLAFIDGSHLAEQALRDFTNIEKLANPRTVVVFDDMLPRNQEEACRVMCPGDWTGDVWRVAKPLQTYRPDLNQILVDTEPTGLMVVYGFRDFSQPKPRKIPTPAMTQTRVPQRIINREGVVSAATALELLSTWRNQWGI